MKNPYEVLGVHNHATQDEIKTAYKELVKKYHPDKYQNNPLADLAQEKLQEINEAYDSITKNASTNQNGFQGNGSYQSTNAAQNRVSPQFMQIRRYIDMGNLSAAEQLLTQIPSRTAEWFFLSGMVSYRKGWYDDASGKIRTATSMDPENFEYQRTLHTIMNSGSTYRNVSNKKGYSSNDDMLCKLLQCYVCTDCLCPCF